MIKAIHRGVIGASLIVMSVLLAAYGPMTTYSFAQSADSSKLSEMKEKATKELDRRISQYKKTLESLKTDVSFDKDGSNTSIISDNGSATSTINKGCSDDSTDATSGATSLSATSTDLKLVVALPCGLEDKVQQFLEKIVEQLEQLKDKVSDTNKLSDMQSLGKNIDSQFGLDQLTQIQAAVTQAIEGMTGVLDKLKTVFNDMQEQVSYIKECFGTASDGAAGVDADVNVSADDSNIAINGTGAGCDKLSLDSKDIADKAQTQLDGMSNVMGTVQSIITSSIALLGTLVSQFSSLTGGLGSLGSLGNLSNLSNLTNLSDIQSMTSNIGDISGILGSFTSILSQLDIANFQADSLMSGLGGLANDQNLSSIVDAVGAGMSIAEGAQSGDIAAVVGGVTQLAGNLSGYGGVGGLATDSLSSSGSSSSTSSSSTNLKQIGKKGDFTGARGGASFRESKRGKECTLDYSRARDMSASGQKLLQMCDSYIGKIESLLGSTEYAHPVQLMYIPAIFAEDESHIKKDYCVTSAYAFAYPSQGRVYACANQFKRTPNNEVAAIHEVAHLTQRYAMGDGGLKVAPYWVTEGLAQYAMHSLGLELSFLKSMGCTSPGYQTYLEGNGYGCAAALFAYIERVYNPDVVKQVQNGSNTKGFTNSLVTKGTNKTISQLYKECLQAECKGGKSL